MCSGIVLRKHACILIPVKEENDMISQDIILVVNGIHSATANRECCSVMVTDPASHIDTPLHPTGQGNHCDNVYHAYTTPTTDHQHSLNGNGICHRIAHHANIVISIDDTFLPMFGPHFDANQSGQVHHKVSEHRAR